MGDVSWVHEELVGTDLGDKRLNDRLHQVLSQFAGQPHASIPAACGGHAEMTAAYRFFDNPKVTFDAVLEPHVQATRARIATQPVVILASDTTELDLTRPQQPVQGAGPLDGGPRRGLFLHLTHAFTPDGTPLGTVQAIPWARGEEKSSYSKMARREAAAVPIEHKESYRWLLSMQQADEEAQRAKDTQIIAVADSESDIFDVLRAASTSAADWIIRCSHDRALVPDDSEGHAAMDNLRAEVAASPLLYTAKIQVRGRNAKTECEDRARRQPRVSREATVEVRAASVTLRAPNRAAGEDADISVNAVLVTEADPPEGDVAVEWLLGTSLPIDQPELVKNIIDYYCIRWMIEIFFRVLKSGCRLERRRFEHLDRLLPCLAVYLMVAWRTLYVCRMGRSCPDMSCEAVFAPEEWQSVYQVVVGEPPPLQPPRLQTMVRLVAQLGGYVNKKRSDDPGPQTIWLGLQRMHDMALCWRAFGPGRTGRDVLIGGSHPRE